MPTSSPSRLFAIGPSRPGPALRRGFLVAAPVGAALFLEFGLDTATKGALATGALLAGFTALDAPARTRAAWQAAVAPLVGLAAGLGVLSGVSLEAADAPPALLLATAGALLQPLFSALVWAAGDRAADDPAKAWSTPAAISALRANLTLRSVSARHALRFGAALAAGVAAYWAIGMPEHGFWIPLTVLFVLRPVEDETRRRLILRAIGTGAGLIFASLLSEWLQGDAIPLALALTLATGFAYGLLTVQYALFTAAITTYAVLLADTLGEPTLEAAGQRAGATAIGIAIAGAAFFLWSNPAQPLEREAFA